MSDIFDVQILVRGAESRTRALHDAFFAGVAARHADARVVTLDLAREHASLPAIDSWDVGAKFEVMYGEGRLDEQQAGHWARITALTDQLHDARVVAISTPMWNLSIPWHLKRWIDCVMQGRLTFQTTPDGFRGLLAGRTGVILTSRNGSYQPGSRLEGLDFQVPYLRTILGAMGIAPIHVVIAEGLHTPDQRGPVLAAAIEEARRLGERIGAELLGNVAAAGQR
jgi:FMN-dependent NADH-azoreductase